MKKNVGWIITVVVLSLMLIVSMVIGATGILNQPAPAPEPTMSDSLPPDTARPVVTPAPCSAAGIANEVARVHAFTREFEDTAQILTSTLMRDTSVDLVQDLQRTRRAAEDQLVPPCLADLKAFQIAHMNARIDVFGTTLAFMNQYGTKGDALMPDGVTTVQDALNYTLQPLYAKADVAARQYGNEYSRLLGLPTPVVPAIPTP